MIRKELLRRAGGSLGIVLSFPGNLVFFLSTYTPPPTTSASTAIPLIACLRSFLQREKQSGRGLPASLWDHNNRDVFGRLSCSIQHPFLIDAFNPDGSRREPQTIYEDIFPSSSPQGLTAFEFASLNGSVRSTSPFVD